jgi:hypothetical protein
MSLTLAVLAFAVPCAPPFQQPDGAPEPGPGGFSVEQRLAPGEQLLEYAWDERGPVPFRRSEARVLLEPGERGRWPATVLYLPGNTLDEATLTGATLVTSQQLGLGEGRFGSALAFVPSTYLHVGLPLRTVPQGGWTLSFWIRPEPGALGRSLLVFDNAFDLSLQSDGRVRATLAGGPSLFSTSTLDDGRWSFVHTTYDPRQTRQFRLVVDGAPVSVLLAPGQPARVPDRLKLGDLGRGGTGFRGVLDEFAFEAGATSTSEALERGQPSVAPGPHTLQLTTTLRERVVSTVSGAIRASALDSPDELARGWLEGAAVIGDELRWVPARWRRLETIGAPAPRTTHPIVALGGGRTLVFGGETRDTHQWPMVNTDDTWIFERATRTWSFVPTTSAPAPRCHMPAAYSPDHDVVLVQGGWRNDSTPGLIYDDTWLFHVTEQRWEQVFPPTPRPGATSDHGLVYLPAKRAFLMLLRDVAWTFDPLTLRWRLLGTTSVVDEAGQPASFLFGASTACALDPTTGLVVLYGGSYGNPPTVFTDTTVLYDVDTNTYTVLAPPVRPPARVRGGFARDARSGRFVLFGGVQDQYSQRKDDLWVFDPRARTWTELDASNAPGRRGGYYGMAYDEDSARFLLSCGRAAFEFWLDETWELELAPTSFAGARYLLDRHPVAPTRRWFADVTAPADSRVTFFARHGDGPEQLGRWHPAEAPLGTARFVEIAVVLRPGSAGEAPTVRAFGFR